MIISSSPSRVIPLLLQICAIAHFFLSVAAFNCEVTFVDGSSNQDVTAHCQANGKDLGSGTMNPFTTYSFVTPVAGNQRIVMTCDMTLGRLHGRFDVFDSNVDAARCAVRAVDWKVDETGLYTLINNAFVLRYRWP